MRQILVVVGSAATLVLASAVNAATPVTPELALSTASATPGLTLAAVLQREADQRAAATMARPDAGYQKQTEFDNTPYRFNMKPGEKLNAEEFEAWMASRGIRIVRAKSEAEPVAAGAATAPVVAQ